MHRHAPRPVIAVLLITCAALSASACREAETEAASAAPAEHRVDVPALIVGP
jgi:hypothetical protein